MKSNLNEAQKKAVVTTNGPLLILAGAGSGKTRVLMYRTLNLLKQNVSPSHILLVTFTNKAAREMSNRLFSLIDKGKCRGLTISTFHALCVRILKRDIHLIGFNNRFDILSDSDQKQIFFEVCRDLKIDFNEISIKEVHSRISLAKNKLIVPEKYPVEESFDKTIKMMYIKYQNYLKQYNALDFDDIIGLTHQLFEKHPQVLMKYQNKFKYVMVDEYQDTSEAQNSIILKLSQLHQNLCVVGDDDQSIYGWRGANFENILQFEEVFPQTVMIKLEQNYRSTTSIIKAANSIISNNRVRSKKNLISNSQDNKKISIIQGNDPWDEAQKVALSIQSMKGTFNYRDFAILFRTNSQTKPIEEMLERCYIPYISPNQYDFYSRKEIKDCLAYLKLLNNLQDDMSLLRIINFPKRSITDKWLKYIKQSAMENENSFYETIVKEIKAQDTKLPIAIIDEMKSFVKHINHYQNEVKGKSMSIQFKNFLGDIDFFAAVLESERKPKVAQRRLDNINHFLNILEEYANKSKEPNIHNFLIKLVLFLSGENEDQKYLNENSVFLSTIHSAKGLEFPCVYVVGMEEGVLPFVYEETGEVNTDEERRLCYVAMTRAMKSLTLSYAKTRKKQGEVFESEPSRFLNEIPSEVLDVV